MIELSLDSDESIIIEAEDIKRIRQDAVQLKELYLTNKNLVYVVTINNGFFAKDTYEIEKVTLENIKIISDHVQVNQIKNNEYGVCLQIQFNDIRELLVFEDYPRRTTAKWINEINRVILGTVPDDVKQITNPLSGLSGFAANIKTVADSAVQTVSSGAKQVAEVTTEQTASTLSSIKEQYANGKKQKKENKVISFDSDNSIFCVHCGLKMLPGTKFCPSCGSPVNGSTLTTTETHVQNDKEPIVGNSESRRQEFAGKILKCPNCGSVISPTTAICPGCGMEIVGQAAISSVQKFSEQLMSIEEKRKRPVFGKVFGSAVDPVDKQKLTLIQSFPIPNTVGDITEFIMLAVANIDVNLSKNTFKNRRHGSSKFTETNITINKTISDAWVSKMKQAYQKAKISFPDDSAFKTLRQIYIDKMQELNLL